MQTRPEAIKRVLTVPPTDAPLDLQGAATLAGVHPVTVRRLVAAGQFPRPFRCGTALRWRREAVMRWINAGGGAVADVGQAAEGVQCRAATAGKAERRYAGNAPSVRSAGGRRTLAGYASVFYRAGDAGTEFEMLPNTFERIAPGAFDRALAEKGDVISLFNHSPDLLLGRTSSGTLRLSKDSRGLRYEVDLPDTRSGDEVFALASRGDLRGSSFSFYPTTSRTFTDGERSIVERVELQLYELGPVISPAYRGATTGLTGAEADRARADRDQLDVMLALVNCQEDAAPARKLPHVARMEKLSADCRRLAGAADRARIANVLNGGTRKPTPKRFILNAAGQVVREK